MKQKRTIYSGILEEVAICTRAAGREPAKVRAAKRKASSEAQAKLNARLSWQKLERILACNFVPKDLVITLTYDEEHLPESRAAAQAKLKKFRKALTEARRSRGEDAVMAYCSENVSGAGRWHHHLVLNATGKDDFAEILSCWPYGQDIEIRRLEVGRGKNYESQARYMTKERQPKGKNAWGCTRNCRRPEQESVPVPNDAQPEIPEDAIILEDVQVRTEYGEFRYVKFLHAAPPPRTRSTRRKRKRGR